MSIESAPGQLSTEFYREFEDARIDPFIRQVFEKMRLYNELLATEFVDSDQINRIMRELDEEWDMLMRREAVITGIMSFLPVDAHGSDGEPVRDFFDTETVVFGGVMPVQMATRYGFERLDDDEDDHHTYELRLHVTREAIDSAGKVVHMVGTAAIDDVLSIEFPNVMSVERAKKWLSYYHADDLDDIEVGMLNPTAEECEMLMRLADITIDVGRPHKDVDHLTLRSVQALNVYTNSLFTFDKDVPYLLQVDGPGWQPDKDGALQPAYLSGRTMSSLDELAWLAADEQPETVVLPHVAARFQSEDKDEPPIRMLVPISSIVSLRSFRYDYFVGYTDDASGK